ncbi:MAG: hypothetical protein HC780_07725 [Leptolyngbyaceae cyanobacterium CSU_1_3]|nr:hypothetical protein [Leptolyngbyaceae cyanobacterium CSU_1_3]
MTEGELLAGSAIEIKNLCSQPVINLSKKDTTEVSFDSAQLTNGTRAERSRDPVLGTNQGYRVNRLPDSKLFKLKLALRLDVA